MNEPVIPINRELVSSLEQRIYDRCLIRVGDLEEENEKLRELIIKVWNCARLLHANRHIEGMRISDEFRAECESAFDELGIEVDG